MKKLIIESKKHSKSYEVLIDDEDYARVIEKRWWIKSHAPNKPYYAIRHVRKVKRSAIYQGMHNFIMAPPPGMVVDHIDGNGLNNQKTNLRICTMAQNAKNRRLSRNNKSGYPGVYWVNREQRWVAYFAMNGTEVCLGYFKTPEAAAAVWKQKAIEIRGEFIRGS